jgi:thermostable 8-oxoguanine DNA glycosylase
MDEPDLFHAEQRGLMQTAAVFVNFGTAHIELPEAGAELLPGIKWGSVDAFPTPAYWAYQVFAHRVLGRTINYRLGATLKEEVGACLLGGHGLPASVGLAAYHRLRELGAFAGKPPAEATLHAWLKQPLLVNGRPILYRFAKQKSHYLAQALVKLEEKAPQEHGRQLRNWLIDIPGIGYKTASWVARNWLNSDDVAILDIHIQRAGRLVGLFPDELTVQRNYLELEELFLEFSRRLGVRASELDAVIWMEMMSSPNSVGGLLGSKRRNSRGLARAKYGQADSNQSALFIEIADRRVTGDTERAEIEPECFSHN